jgi:hypothetical protein
MCRALKRHARQHAAHLKCQDQGALAANDEREIVKGALADNSLVHEDFLAGGMGQ